ncbi:hypothetical protein ZWY2020_036818 [Hordeum vulgare]|nr:hypothetical protein ZWY2020_036818 [Hordeum vulgare]
MVLRNAASISAEALLLSKHMAYSITDASQGSPNSSWDILKSSPKTVVPRNASGTSNLTPSLVYTTKWPLPATDGHDVPHDPSVSSIDVDDDQVSLFRPIAATLCHFLANRASFLTLIMVAYLCFWKQEEFFCEMELEMPLSVDEENRRSGGVLRALSHGFIGQG